MGDYNDHLFENPLAYLMWQKLWCSRLGDQKWVFESWGQMGNKGSRGRNGLSKETVDFLVKNTKFSREMIKVAVSDKTESLLACTRCSKVVSYLQFHLFACSVVHTCFFCLLTSGTPVQRFHVHLFACVGVVHWFYESFRGSEILWAIAPIPLPSPPTRAVLKCQMLGTETTFKANFIIHPASTKRREEGGAMG